MHLLSSLLPFLTHGTQRPSRPKSLLGAHSMARAQELTQPRVCSELQGAGARVDTPTHTYVSVHTCTHTPSRHTCYPASQSNSQGRTAGEEGWPSHRRTPGPTLGPRPLEKVVNLRAPRVELAGRHLRGPRLALSGVIQDSPGCRHGCCVQGLGRGGAGISTQGDPERAKPESQALRILEAKIGVPLDPRGYRGAGRARTTVRCPALSLELRLRLTLGLGLAEGWSPEPVTRSGCKLLRVFGSSRAGKPRDKDLAVTGRTLHEAVADE